ncbi:hypothetical protein ACNS7O_17560 (plasmid) [Haloferacaceae archaeon DSL9]
MVRDGATEHETPMRRDYVTYGGAVVVGGLLAGWTGSGGSDSAPAETETTDTPTGTENETATDSSYSATMEPVGAVAFGGERLFDRGRTADIIDGNSRL